MARFGRLGRTAWRLTKGGRRLQKVARNAERSPRAASSSASARAQAERLEIRPTLPQAALLVRYIAGRFVLGVIETYALSKWAFLFLAALFLSGLDWPRGGDVTFNRTPLLTAVGVIFLLVAGIVWLIQRMATRAVRRVGALDRLAGLDDFGLDAVLTWWPNLRAEFRRVGLRPSAWGMAKLGAGYATRRLSAEQKAALAEVRWFAVLPSDQLNEAQRVLAHATDDDGSAAAGGEPR